MTNNTNIAHQLKTLPEAPGIYKYFDADEKLLYVGKAKNLKKRVGSYFNKTHDSAKLNMLVKKIKRLEYIVTQTEHDALLLENTLIKKYQPRYNVNLKDDKTYPWICIKNEPFPRVFHTRKKIADGSEYYGPYSSVTMLRTLLELIRELYPIRTCNLNLTDENIAKQKFRVCLEYHIGKCLGPCENKQSAADYQWQIEQVKQIIKGNIKKILQSLKEKMKALSAELKFEEAQVIKQKIDKLEQYKHKSTVITNVNATVDVYSIISDEKWAYINYLKIYEGSLIQSYTIELAKKLEETDAELLQLAITELRQKFNSDAKEIILPFEIEYYGVNVVVPQRGDKKQLLELSERNAKYYMLDKYKQEKIKNPEQHTERVLQTMKKDLRLNELPDYIECFDNSNLQGTNAVSACVVFKNAKPSKKDYRHFTVNTVQGPDDFATMREVIYRRYKRLLEEKQDLPKLIVIDGGKGQLSAAIDSLEKLNLKGKIAIIGIAKKLEEIYYPGDSLPLYIDKRSETLKVIQYMRNEAHRFGITHHRNKRSKSTLKTELTNIKGIGEKTAELLLKKFKSVKRIKQLHFDDLVKVIGKEKAKTLINFFNKRV